MKIIELIKAMDCLELTLEDMLEIEVFIADSQNGDLPITTVDLKETIEPKGIHYIYLKGGR
jgi:hypothetical protein